MACNVMLLRPRKRKHGSIVVVVVCAHIAYGGRCTGSCRLTYNSPAQFDSNEPCHVNQIATCGGGGGRGVDSFFFKIVHCIRTFRIFFAPAAGVIIVSFRLLDKGRLFIVSPGCGGRLKLIDLLLSWFVWAGHM